MLKICQKDWQSLFEIWKSWNSFKMLHKMSKRATPEMWSNYSAACHYNECSWGYFCKSNWELFELQEKPRTSVHKK
jgi:hypothetical protein